MVRGTTLNSPTPQKGAASHPGTGAAAARRYLFPVTGDGRRSLLGPEGRSVRGSGGMHGRVLARGRCLSPPPALCTRRARLPGPVIACCGVFIYPLL